MASDDRDRLLAHRYDGIQEYDNPLPGWWVWLFWATIVFSVLYWGYYHLGPGPSILAEYEAEVKAAAERQARLAPTAPQAAAVPGVAVSDDAIEALRNDTGAMARARELYASRCLACHGPQGQGLIGPNLTDDYWLHGSRPTDVYRVISEGVPDKGMIPWKTQLSVAEMQALAAWIGTLRGTNPPNPKAPQGEKG